jgi:hypothetical protein
LTETDFHYFEWYDGQDEDVKNLGKQEKFALYRNWLYFDIDGFDMDGTPADREADSLARSLDYGAAVFASDSAFASMTEMSPADEAHAVATRTKEKRKADRKANIIGHCIHEGRIGTTIKDMYGAYGMDLAYDKIMVMLPGQIKKYDEAVAAATERKEQREKLQGCTSASAGGSSASAAGSSSASAASSAAGDSAAVKELCSFKSAYSVRWLYVFPRIFAFPCINSYTKGSYTSPLQGTTVYHPAGCLSLLYQPGGCLRSKCVCFEPPSVCKCVEAGVVEANMWKMARSTSRNAASRRNKMRRPRCNGTWLLGGCNKICLKNLKKT